MPKQRKRFRRGWRVNRQWYYVSGRGDSGYCHDRAYLRDRLRFFEEMGVEVAVFKLKKKGWRP